MSNAGAVTENSRTTPLSKIGAIQAGMTVSFALYPKPDLIISSPLVRSLQTAMPIAKKFPDVPKEIWDIEEFTYLNEKKYFHSTINSRKELQAVYWSHVDPDYIDGDGAESFRNFFDVRVPNFLQKIRLEKKEKLTYVFTHGQFIRGVILKILFPAMTATEKTMSFFENYSNVVKIPNCAILMLLIRDGSFFLNGISISHIPIHNRTE